MNPRLMFLVLIASLLLSACAGNVARQQPPLSEVLQQHAVGPLALVHGDLFVDNDDAFNAKLEIIRNAEQSLDLAYYILADDYSSAAFAQALIDAAKRGVKVRLLLDYFSAYRQLDRLDWLEREGAGNLNIRLYNPPTAEIIRDAAYLTLSCADVGVDGKDCSQQKNSWIAQAFAAQAAAGTPASEANLAGSGLFLSGLYGKQPAMMASAISRGQSIDVKTLAEAGGDSDAAQLEKLKALGKLYFRARYLGGIDGLSARLQLAFVRLAFAEQVNPVFAALNSYLPVSRQDNSQAQRDWDYLTEFMHHKLLMADTQRLMLGGRNVEDAYHLHGGPLADKYIFMDTDVRLQLAEADPALQASFDRLWQLPGMVATLAEVRRHAPNDHLVNFTAFTEAYKICGEDEECASRNIDRHFLPLEKRLANIAQRHRDLLQRFQKNYQPAPSAAPIAVAPDVVAHYLENLPQMAGRRTYGARLDREAADGKAIHAAWRTALQETCAAGHEAGEVIIHNAYLFLPANLLAEIGAALDGRRPCPGTRITLLTNSLETTDLSIVNLLAVWQLKALADHLAASSTSASAASLRYFEYRPVGELKRSLHSKVMLFGDKLFIGSANADVRSLMMDSNNGILITNAPQTIGEYREWLTEILDNPARVDERTATLGRDQQVLQAEMDAHIDHLLARYASERLNAAQEAELRESVQATVARVYELSRAILRGDRGAAERFNALFKAI